MRETQVQMARFLGDRRGEPLGHRVAHEPAGLVSSQCAISLSTHSEAADWGEASTLWIRTLPHRRAHDDAPTDRIRRPGREFELRAQLKACEAKLARYRDLSNPTRI